MKKLLKISLAILFFSTIFIACNNDEDKTLTNVILYDKPLSVIKDYTAGNWKLLYIFGGFGAIKHEATDNDYMNINNDHIIIGDDKNGIVVDTDIVWVKEKMGVVDSTYLMSYNMIGDTSEQYEYKIVQEIKNDTLILIDNVSDPYYRYYVKY